MGEDIDDRKPQHERLTEQARLLDLTTDAIIVRDPTDRVVYWNLAAEEMYSYTRHQAMGRVTHDLLQTQFPAPLKEILQHLHRHGRWSGELVHTRADGRRITAFSRWVLDWDQSGNPTSVVETNHDITDRKHSEEQLARSEERYRSLVSVITDVPWTTDANGGFVTPQPAWTAYTGQSWEELRGFGWTAALHPDDREQVKRTWEGACAERTPYESRGRLWHAPSQQYRYFIARATPILNPDNSVREWVGACTDVHERETAENRLAVLARISELIGTLDDPGELLFGVSRTVGEHLSVRRCLFGEIDLANDCGTVRRDYCRGVASVAGVYRLSEYSSLTTQDMQAGKTVVNRDSRSDPRTAASYQGTYERNAERAYVAVPLLRDRRWVATLWVSDDVPRPWREQEVALLETVAERTWTAVEKRRIAAALRESDARFRTVINQATTGVFQADATGRMTLVNQRWCELLGYTEAELLQLTLAEVTDPETITPTLEALRRLADGGPDIVLEQRYRRRDGSMFWASSSVNAIRDPRGEYQGLVAVVLDITERKQAEESVFYQKRLLEALTESVVDGILIVSPEGRMVHFNQRFLDIWNFPRNIIQSRSDEAALRWAAEQTADPRAFLERVTAVYARPEEQVREEMLMKDGRVYERCGSPIQSGTDRLGWVWTFRDITDRKRAEAALRSAERMEAVGRLAGGVAHETNNQMTVVLGCASFALRAPDLPRETREELLSIQKAAERTAAITAQLLAFSRRQILRPEPLDLNAVLESFAPILRRTLGEASELTLNLSPRLGPIVADRGQIEQVLVNLTLNARDAMPDGGTLTIETEPTALARPELTSYAGELLPPGRYGVLTMRDTGHGMAPDTLVRIFEPFFTTKPLGRGTGLGLSTVYGIARQLGGDIRVRSAPGAGTAFRVYLPLAESPMASGGAPAPSLSVGAAGTLLVVEDEPLVRALAVRALRAEGFEVLEAEHGQAALELLDRQGGTVQAVVSDVAMPVMGGRELAERLARSHPTVPVLLVSGYAADELVRRGMLADDGVPLLRKPFGPEALVERVRALVSPVRSVMQ